jgi:protein-export membrane protein SecD
MEGYFLKKNRALKDEVKKLLRPRADSVTKSAKFPLSYRNLKVTAQGVTVDIIGDDSEIAEAKARLESLEDSFDGEASVFDANVAKYKVTQEGENRLSVSITEEAFTAKTGKALEQTAETLRRRIDGLGTREASVFPSGDRRVVVQAPGVKDSEGLKKEIGKTAQMSFHMATDELIAPPGVTSIPGRLVAESEEEPGQYYILEETPLLTGDNLTDAGVSGDENGRPAVSFVFDAVGAQRFGDVTKENIGRIFAIVLDGKVISAPRIQSAITGGSGMITGNFTAEEAGSLALLLRSGALPTDLIVAEERVIGPELGKESVNSGKQAIIAGFLAVSLFMIAYYGLPGVFSVFALVVNVFAVFGALTWLNATLTLPGIAGLVLGMGVAVDANVLINERIREELRDGAPPFKAVSVGYERAWVAILDSHVTGLVSALIMFALGAGPIRGFAVTMALGVITSLFTAVWVTRLLFAGYMYYYKPKTVRFGLSGT